MPCLYIVGFRIIPIPSLPYLQVAERFIAAIEASQKQKPALNFLIAWSKDDILKQAEASKQRYAQGEGQAQLLNLDYCSFNLHLVQRFVTQFALCEPRTFSGRKLFTRFNKYANHAASKTGSDESLSYLGEGSDQVDPAF